MNIFYTHQDPKIAAKEHCDVHIRKMIIEYAQMLSTAHRVLTGDSYADDRGLYKATHTNHPCTVWVRSGLSHYLWVFECFKELCRIFEDNRGKTHATARLIKPLSAVPMKIPICKSEPPKCFPDKFKEYHVERGYQLYLNEKFREWREREKPMKYKWFGEIPYWVE